MSQNLIPVTVEYDRNLHAGFLYIETETHAVLLNDVSKAAPLGKIENEVDCIMVPEATVVIVPLGIVKTGVAEDSENHS